METSRFVEITNEELNSKWKTVYEVELFRIIWKWRMIIALNFPIEAIGKKKPEKKKNQGLNGIRTRDLRVIGALLYQLSYEATHWERGQFIEFISPVRSEMKWSIWNNFQLLKLEKFTAMIILHFHLQPQFKNELFHIYFSNSLIIH